VNDSNRVISFFDARKRTLIIALAYILWGFCWLLANWPGAMTVDSLETWIQSTTWQYAAADPWLNAFSYSIARLLWDSPACIAIIQIFAFSFYFASILTYFNRCGFKTRFLKLIGLSIFLGLPIWLYAIMLWKDVPFTLCLIAAVFALYKIIMDYRDNMSVCQLTSATLFSLYIIGVFAFRFNGIFAFGLLLFFFHPAFGSWKRRGLFFLSTSFCIVLILIIIPLITKIHTRTHQLSDYGLFIINPIAALHHAPGGYRTPDPELDRQVLGQIFDIDCLKERYDPLHIRPALSCLRTNDVEPEQVSRLIRTYLPRLLENPEVVIADRIQMFQSAIMHTSKRYGLRWVNVLADPSDAVFPRPIVEVAKSIGYGPVKLFTKVLKPFNYLWQRVGVLVWNAFPGLIMTLAMVVLYRFVPITASICIVVLMLTAGTLMVLPGDSFRYFFYLYVLAPVLLLMGLNEGRSALRARYRLLLFSTDTSEFTSANMANQRRF
jgi:hypothetical protein